ncbi:MAG: energy-coupling factor transporter ATPase [Ezakiella sp.]|nr:energy-coupling factor transporter ATPase [Ezakiella sp.]MDD7471461.1 energy-coupling factor transporter ATPase [Bacillota bacterium]MDY3922855.1 energy-coupling factor transporter ATPase [Ezakiella sp.]
MAVDNEKVISLKNVSFSYSSNIDGEKLLAIDDVSMDIKKGEFVAVLGSNGSGKSTLCKLINAQIFPNEGDVIVNNINTKEEDRIWDIRKNCGMVFQNPDNQIVATIVEEDVAFGPENLGVPPSEIRERVDNALRIVDMLEYKEHSPNLLSGGQKQRVAIAGILAINPDIILFDEPTAMLDPSGRKEVLKTILQLNRENNKTILLITHYMQEAIDADRIIVFDDGKIVKTGTPKEIFSEPETLKRYGLDAPFVPVMEKALGNAKTNCESFDLEDYAKCVLEKIKEKNSAPFDMGSYQKFRAGEVKEFGIYDQSAEVATDKLSHVYGEGTPFEKKAVKDVTMSIANGEFIGVIGHTGSGKSTFIQHLNALMFPTSGKIAIEGQVIDKKMRLIGIREKVGMVFQYPEHQLFEETCAKDVAYGPKNLGLTENEIDRRVVQAIKDVGLDYDFIKDRSPFELSGGQKRRLAIAGVLAMEPKILVLDEPTAGLDPRGRNEIINLIKGIQDKKKLTIVYVTHSMEDIAKIADRILVMDKGELKYYDTPEKIFKREEELESIGLDVPYTVEFMNILRKNGVVLPQALSPEEAADSIRGLLQ